MTGLVSRTGSWRDRLDPVLLAVLAAGLLLRLAGIGHSLPQVYNPDEVSILSRALALASGDLNPHNFLYPSLYFYVLAATIGAFAVLARLTGSAHSLAQFEGQFWQDPTSVYLVGRSLSVLAGVLTIWAVYRLALKLGDRTVARVAAILMAVAYIPVRDAHFIKHDVPATLLVTVAALASWWVWRRGSTRDYVAAGACAGVAAAFHYPAGIVVVALVTAHVLRTRSSTREIAGPRIWAAALAAALTFVVCSPYVLLDFPTAVRDIQANRAIIVERAQKTFGTFGSAAPQVHLLLTQGTGAAWLAAACIGLALVARTAGANAIWIAAFPVAFFALIANTWPFGRTANPLYPFLAVLGGVGLVGISRAFGRRAGVALTALTLVAAAQPLYLSAVFDRLVSQTDTRTAAMAWVEANAPAGTTVAVEPYSVQLQPTRAHLQEALRRPGVSPSRIGHRARALLARDPYPAPAYRLFYIGEGGMDEDKIYVPPGAVAADAPWLAPGCLQYVILKSAAPYSSNPLSSRMAAIAELVHRESPFVDSAQVTDGMLPDFDVAPSLQVSRPGPIIEVWRLAAPCDGSRGTSR